MMEVLSQQQWSSTTSGQLDSNTIQRKNMKVSLSVCKLLALAEHGFMQSFIFCGLRRKPHEYVNTFRGYLM